MDVKLSRFFSLVTLKMHNQIFAESNQSFEASKVCHKDDDKLWHEVNRNTNNYMHRIVQTPEPVLLNDNLELIARPYGKKLYASRNLEPCTWVECMH